MQGSLTFMPLLKHVCSEVFSAFRVRVTPAPSALCAARALALTISQLLLL